MPRARNIKPSFFINEDLVELGFATRLLFIGLWTLADREGRLQDRPKTIKMSIFPADNIEVDEGLSELARCGLIIRYEIENTRLIQITNFVKHQKPHQNEAPSVLPNTEGLVTKAEALALKVEARGSSTLKDERGKMKAALAEKARKPKPKQQPKTFDEIVAEQSAEPVYATVDVVKESLKAAKWIRDNPGRKFTRKFFVDWLNRIDTAVILPPEVHPLTAYRDPYTGRAIGEFGR